MVWLQGDKYLFGLGRSVYHEMGNQRDALTIRKNATIAISAPEYKREPYKNEPFAYIMGQSNRTIRVKFNSNASNMNFLVKATVVSGEGIGHVCEIFVAACDLNTTVFTIKLQGSIPNSVCKRTFTWRWEATALPENSPYCPITCTPVNTQHTYYTLLATPQAPMSIPWTEVLDYACVWAGGETSQANAATKITEFLYACGFNYETGLGAPRYSFYQYPTYFNVTLLLFDLQYPTDIAVNCLDMGRAVVTFGNALGANLNLTRFYSSIYNKPFPLNCIDPIGSPSPTNNTFSSPLIYNDCRTGGFGYHAFAANNERYVWDATLKYDIDNNPDNVSGSNPGCGNYNTSGFIWQLPCNESQSTYLSRLVDYWIRPNNEGAIDCTDPEMCGIIVPNETIVAK